ncbi:mannonate dehydratase [Paenibacillus sp. MWE-103]|uniref:Mannonate dehydratase n=1 Tax=Paenibacillus artemisiicola TaxID=1172618 RepID=A0ABS3WBN8_9BACL|nr:mannonate dehydratase [Paenibacillus artemisiicola]MBO7745730.1 mannonate dehydratase [Paenibacillus artemisiicola]
MKMVFRWFGEGNDTVTLKQIKQIPGVEGIVWALHDVPAGEEWPMAKILEVKQAADRIGLHTKVVESVNIHEDIKLGLPSRDRYLDNYKKTIAKLAQVGVKVICYNFMPVFDWVRTELHKEMEDGSTALFYEHQKAAEMDPSEQAERINANQNFTMPGWEPERMARLTELFAAYQGITEEQLWSNAGYFLNEIIPFAAQHDIVMVIHPDDPPWPIFGLPRLITNQANIRRYLDLFDSPYNGLTMCSGSLGANPANDIVAIVNEFADRIPFAHIRNVRVYENGDFIETSHRTCDGTVDIAGIVDALARNGFEGFCRPDHGRHIWGEQCRPGYGLYDRALGIMYLWGLWDASKRSEGEVAP